ncbi:hypothetical protein BDN71DRAFT_1436054 [Pleurotus eryngii]|uniref:Uncharacterized protein n=1 Tax=Pleurotus eryngii TaxID=5323 RepID=A0A9P6D9D3_PLEER|nr:hypothetical protein BDN71DRAFT_1436054 [Pleurotus eryngii]
MCWPCPLPCLLLTAVAPTHLYEPVGLLQRVPSVPPTPRAMRVSPRKLEVPSKSPAVAISSNLAPSPVPSQCLSFSTVDVDAEVVISPKKARRPVATRGEAEASLEVEASTPSKRAGFKWRSTIKASKQLLSSGDAARDWRQANPAKRIRPIARKDSVDKVSKTSSIDIPPKGIPASSPPLSDDGED